MSLSGAIQGIDPLRNIGRIFRFPDGSRSFENAVAQSLLNKITMKTRSSIFQYFWFVSSWRWRGQRGGN